MTNTVHRGRRTALKDPLSVLINNFHNSLIYLFNLKTGTLISNGRCWKSNLIAGTSRTEAWIDGASGHFSRAHARSFMPLGKAVKFEEKGFFPLENVVNNYRLIRRDISKETSC